MSRLTFFTLFICLNAPILIFSQAIKGRVIDAETQKPIPFANVLLSDTYGVITNDEGYFSILQKDFKEQDVLRFSMLGYEERRISVKEVKANAIILLKPSSMMLDEVIVGLNMNPKEIIRKYYENSKKNHRFTGQRMVYFVRNNYKHTPRKFSIKVDQVSFVDKKALQKKLDKYSSSIEGKTLKEFTEKMAEIFITPGGQKAYYFKALKLKDPNALDPSDFENEMITQVFTYLESPHTYKVSSGIFTIDREATFDDLEEETSSDKVMTRSFSIKPTSGDITHEDFMKDNNDYRYTLLGVRKIGDMSCYHISFEPKGVMGKHVGELYINTDDFGMVYYKYQLAPNKKEYSVNLKLLFGFKAQSDGWVTEAMMAKFPDGKYYTKWKKTSGNSYAYFNRSIKMVENNPNRRERKKLKIVFLVEMLSSDSEEIFAVEFEPFSEPNVSGIRPPEYIYYDIRSSYYSDYWKGYNVIEATEEIKNFKPQVFPD